jgi:hypothetical protein
VVKAKCGDGYSFATADNKKSTDNKILKEIAMFFLVDEFSLIGLLFKCFNQVKNNISFEDGKI